MSDDSDETDDRTERLKELVAEYNNHIRAAKAFLDADDVKTELYHDGSTWMVSFEYDLDSGEPDMKGIEAARRYLAHGEDGDVATGE